ncbi:hypothetical protein Leryth_022362 [Lithospermum erythrorhizon]|nr:hypothetical protein Leryth_022362 [Lithospermum erythrorhizon]
MFHVHQNLAIAILSGCNAEYKPQKQEVAEDKPSLSRALIGVFYSMFEFRFKDWFVRIQASEGLSHDY